MADMRVKLFHITPPAEIENRLLREGIRIKPAIAPDKSKIEDFAGGCLIIGDIPNGDGFFRQTRQIFAGILSYGKKI